MKWCTPSTYRQIFSFEKVSSQRFIRQTCWYYLLIKYNWKSEVQNGKVRFRYFCAAKFCVIWMVANVMNINPLPVANITIMHPYTDRITRAIGRIFDTMCSCKHMMWAYQSSSAFGVRVIKLMIKDRYLPRNRILCNFFSTKNP